MAEAPMRLIKSVLEYLPKDEWSAVAGGTRGFYVLYNHRRRHGKDDNFDVVYVGMARKSIKSRLRSHTRSLKKEGKWTHFSIYEVWDNISAQEIAELEGLFRHLYRWDSRANSLNAQRSFKPLNQLRRVTEELLERPYFRRSRKRDGTRGGHC